MNIEEIMLETPTVEAVTLCHLCSVLLHNSGDWNLHGVRVRNYVTICTYYAHAMHMPCHGRQSFPAQIPLYSADLGRPRLSVNF